MSLTDILRSRYVSQHIADDYAGICLDSRQCTNNSVFVALTGSARDGWDYCDQAVSLGATLVLTNSPNWTYRDDISVIYDPQLNGVLGDLAAEFYGHPSKKLGLIGVTGTNGKTSVCQFISQLLTTMGYPCGYVGTNGYGLWGDFSELNNTTPDIFELNRILATLVTDGADFCAIEVSSHGLDQHRVDGLLFKTVGFTNLTRDHLDYHGDMESYAQAKSRLFYEFDYHTAVINLDDDFGRQLLTNLNGRPGIYSYSTCENADLMAVDPLFTPEGQSFDLDSPWGEKRISVPLYGEFNQSNLLAAAGLILSLGMEFSSLINALTSLESVKGRMEFIPTEQNKAIAVDYAHTPDALEKALLAMRQHCRGRLWVIFGCGGDRDKGKRPLMAAIAEKQADFIIVTDDNPRTEDSEAIMADIAKGFAGLPQKGIWYQSDRRSAIEIAVAQSVAGDAILIAGKGHESYQIVGTEKFDFSDQSVVLELAGGRV